MIRFLISVPQELHQTLREISKTRGQTLTGFIREILWDWFENQKGADK